jgi:preprotein translocase subunit YajC
MLIEVFEPGFVLALSASSNPATAGVVQLIPFALVLAIFYFIILLPMKKRQKKVQEFLSALKVGDRVITSGGIYGSITKITDQTLQLQVAQNVRLEVARSAIVGYQGQPPVVDAQSA